jgi:hypothetical protein
MSTSEAVSSSPEESYHSKSDTETHLGEVGADSGKNIEVPSTDQTEEIVDITSLSPVDASATLVDPLNIDYSDPEPESDEDCAART